MTNTFCPFLRDICKGNGCMMFRDEECLVVSFLETVRESTPSPAEEAEVPDWIEKRTPEELALEIFEFAKKEQKEAGLDYDSASRCFWESKGVRLFPMPSEVQSKMQRADFLARKQALQDEKDELPSLIGKCVDWARNSNLNKVAIADVDAFLLEKDLHLLRETKRALYSMANLKLKTGK